MLDQRLDVPDLVTWTLSGEHDEDNPILIDADNPVRSISKRTAVELVSRLAGQFRPDSTVCLHIPNDVLYPILCLGIQASRCCWTGTNPAYTASEIQHHLKISRAAYVITLPKDLATIASAVEASGTDAEIIIFTDVLEPAVTVESEKCQHPTLHDMLRPESDAVDLSSLTLDVDSVAALMQTSGTTGLPKMAARTHRALVLESKAVEDATKPYEIRRLLTVPIFHGFGAPQMIINALRYGHTTFIARRFDDTFPSKVQQFEITETAAPPPMMLRWLKYDESTREKLQSLRMIWSGGAPLSEELRRKTIALFTKMPRIVQVWGMTEGGWFTTFNHPEVGDDGSVGRLIDGVEMKLATDKTTKMHNGNVAGELLIRSPHLMTHYLGNQKATEETITADGWLRTGDIGYMCDGKVFLIDRIKDLVKVNGFQVAPAELEDALLQSPHVSDAAVIGVGSGTEEHPLAFVTAATADATSLGIKEHLLTKLTKYKVASCEIRFVDSIPKSASGKILKTVLRSQYLQGAAAVKVA